MEDFFGKLLQENYKLDFRKLKIVRKRKIFSIKQHQISKNYFPGFQVLQMLFNNSSKLNIILESYNFYFDKL